MSLHSITTLKRERPDSDVMKHFSTNNNTQEPSLSPLSLCNTNTTSIININFNVLGHSHDKVSDALLQDAIANGEAPYIAAFLNNEAVFLMEHKEYAATKQALRIVLRFVEDHQRHMPLATILHSAGHGPLALSASGVPGPISCMIAWKGTRDTRDEKKHYRPRSEYDEGMDFFGVGLRLESSSRNLDATILYNLGRTYHLQSKYDRAVGFYRRALLSLEQWQVCDATVMLAVLLSVAQIQYLRNQHVDSLATCHVALSLAKDCFGTESLEVAACWNCIGVVRYIMPGGDSEQALLALRASLEYRLYALGETHLDTGTTYNNIGRVHFQRGEFQQAMESYENALRIRRTILGDAIDVAATIFNMGQAHHQLGDRTQAMTLYREFLTMAKAKFGDYHRDIAIVMTCIGQVHHEEKNYQTAMESFQEALRVGRTALGPLHPEIAMTLNKVGNLYYEMGDLDAALQVYRQGLTVEEAVLEAGNANVLVTLTNIAEIHKQSSEFDSALLYYTKVLALQRKHVAENPQEIANTLSSIGFVRHQMGDYSGALDCNQECLRIRRDINGDMDEDVAVSLTHIALVLLKMNGHEIALEVLMESYRIRTALQTEDTRDIAFTLYNIAMIYHHRGSYEHALVFYRETARVEQSALGRAHRDVGITFYNIGQIHYQRGDMELALDNFEKALEIERECLGHDNPTCARTLNEIGNIELQRGNIVKVMECFSEALRIYRKAGMDDSHLVIYGRKLYRFELVHPNAASAA